MDQQRLFVLAVEAIALTAVFVPGQGWSVKIGMRRQAESWGAEPWTEYSHMTTAEMLDTIEGHLASKL